jgi:hypothetical protein
MSRGHAQTFRESGLHRGFLVTRTGTERNWDRGYRRLGTKQSAASVRTLSGKILSGILWIGRVRTVIATTYGLNRDSQRRRPDLPHAAERRVMFYAEPRRAARRSSRKATRAFDSTGYRRIYRYIQDHRAVAGSRGARSPVHPELGVETSTRIRKAFRNMRCSRSSVALGSGPCLAAHGCCF